MDSKNIKIFFFKQQFANADIKIENVRNADYMYKGHEKQLATLLFNGVIW